MMTTWLIDTALFKSLAPGRSQGFRTWLEANDSPVFLSAASLVEIEAAIARVPAGQAQRAQALRKWLEDITTHFGDRIHPVDDKIAVRAGALLPLCHAGHPRHRFHDALLVATTQLHDHGLLTKRDAVFGAWANVRVASP